MKWFRRKQPAGNPTVVAETDRFALVTYRGAEFEVEGSGSKWRASRIRGLDALDLLFGWEGKSRDDCIRRVCIDIDEEIGNREARVEFERAKAAAR